MPADAPRRDVTQLLESAAAGRTEAFDEVFRIVYDELRQLARQVRRGRGATLNTTALVHEAYLRLLPSRDYAWEGRRHFMGVAARAMRQVLVRAAERRTAGKRGGVHDDLSLDEAVHAPLDAAAGAVSAEQIIALDGALSHLETLNPRQARVVECRFFAGLSVEETAAALDVSAPTVKRDWRAARAWLARALA